VKENGNVAIAVISLSR